MGNESSVRVPNRRMDDLVVTESGGDILLYDERTFALHTLNEVAVRVWDNIDDAQTLRDLTVLSGLDVETVKQSLKQLQDINLLDGALPAEARPTGSRRSFLKKAGIAAAAVPVIASVTAPMASAQITGDLCSTQVICSQANAGLECNRGTGGPCGYCEGIVTFRDPLLPCALGCPPGYPICRELGSVSFCAVQEYMCIPNL